jgi:hypothetical protein
MPNSRNDPCVCPAIVIETLILALSQGERVQKLEATDVNARSGVGECCLGRFFRRGFEFVEVSGGAAKPASKRPYDNR